MDNKSKIIIIVLGVISVVLGVIAFQSIQSFSAERKKYAREIDRAQGESEDLRGKLQQANSELSSLQNKLETAQREMTSIKTEQENWKSKYEVALGEKEELINKIEELKKIKESVTVEDKKGSAAAYSASDDSYWASVLKDKAGLEIEVAGLKQQMESLNMKMEEAAKKNTDLEFELNELNRIKTDLERQISYSEKLSKSLSEELVREKKDRKVLSEELGKIRQDYNIMQQQLSDTNNSKMMLARQVSDFKEENKILTKKIAEMDQVLQDRMGEIMKIKDSLTTMRSQTTDISTKSSKVVELPPIIVKADSSAAGSPMSGAGVSAQILAVNKENNFVVMDAGESSGVRSGMLFDVYRSNVKIASIKVIQVRSDISAADITYIYPGQQIQVGDLIR
ncbi:MAG: hypothetical protein COV72_03710 [Candidatus Omnitrophica bacterium CG11_big_fil_rev_8_21_14_0_20_42_13]|uniref:Uncharacterized protein n=1 Tax=Candidatus Ghiorseimicrobium undicola TaxID=1974746 RepID=A0A2H0LY29_9BACT|nr:MAG: hypothetical protein COV72_03710 [Candidatus Omnitrophica bacterium CG11_big_fil_rev_8_21_14_0_20_42_13]